MEEAEKRHRAALENDRQLLREHPEEPELFRAMAADWQELGDDLCAQVKHADALNAYTQLFLAAERLAYKYGSDKDRIYLATACDKLALIHAQLGSLTTALVYANRCVELSQRLAADPLDVPGRRNLVMAWQRLGDLYRQNGDNDNASPTLPSWGEKYHANPHGVWLCARPSRMT
jgi:tetratricopeptide (TPR) repeat protein